MERSAKRHFWIKWTSLELVCVGRYKYYYVKPYVVRTTYVVVSSTHYTVHSTQNRHAAPQSQYCSRPSCTSRARRSRRQREPASVEVAGAEANHADAQGSERAATDDDEVR